MLIMRFYTVIENTPDTRRTLQLAAEKLCDWIEATTLSSVEQRIVCGEHINVDEDKTRTSQGGNRSLKVVSQHDRGEALPAIVSSQSFPEVWKFSPRSAEHNSEQSSRHMAAVGTGRRLPNDADSCTLPAQFTPQRPTSSPRRTPKLK